MLIFTIICILFICSIILTITIYHKIHQSDFTSWATEFVTMFFCLTLTVTLGVVLFVQTITLFQYHNFTHSIERQREVYELTEKNGKNNDGTTKIVDIMKINEQLNTYKADRDCWGKWSLYPASVYNIEPIGVYPEDPAAEIVGSLIYNE